MIRKIGSLVLALSVFWAVVSLVVKNGIGVSVASDHAVLPSNIVGACINSSHFEGCEWAGDLIQPFIDLGQPTNSDEFNQLSVDEMEEVLRLKRKTTCDECISAIQVFEEDLSTNGTAENIIDTLDTACVNRFQSQNSTVEQDCESEIAVVPPLISSTLSNEPPLPACELMGFCP